MPADGEARNSLEQDDVAADGHGRPTASSSGASVVDATARVAELEARLGSLEGKLREKESVDEEKVRALRDEIEGLKRDRAMKEVEMIRELELEAQKLRDEKTKLCVLEGKMEAQNCIQEMEKRVWETERRRKSEEVEEERSKVKALEKRMQELQQEKGDMAQRITELERNLSETSGKLADALDGWRKAQLQVEGQEREAGTPEAEGRCGLLPAKATNAEEALHNLEKASSEKEKELGGRLKVAESEARQARLIETSLRAELAASERLLQVERERTADLRRRFEEGIEANHRAGHGSAPSKGQEREMWVNQGRLEESKERERDALRSLREEERRREQVEAKLLEVEQKLADERRLLVADERHLSELRKELSIATEALQEAKERELKKDEKLKSMSEQVDMIKGDVAAFWQTTGSEPANPARRASLGLTKLKFHIASLKEVLDKGRRRTSDNGRVQDLLQAIECAAASSYVQDTMLLEKLLADVKENKWTEVRACLAGALGLKEKSCCEEHGGLLVLLAILCLLPVLLIPFSC